MSANEKVLVVVGEWVIKAENDLKTAAYTLRLGKDCPTDTVCFHAQQCVEKYLKALLTLRGIDFPKTHDIGAVIALVPGRSDFALSIEQQRRLTNYATAARYPGWGEIPLGEARQALALARRVRAAVRRLLPRQALRSRK
ncbi:MAG: hypothetical protein A3G24_09280 [Betaproteobacteria bacterium RIFCSPLOWO2_12_FULL_62_13]|nr:MAG: hypothetical protein A3G24_09280 [Betaproteobacteria bacterium RIFCSPLOWO2_12_FULL_62_13]